MTRRTLLATSAAATLAGSAAASSKKATIELLVMKFRNGPENQRQRAGEFFKAFVPAAKRAGIGPVGVFSNTIGPGGPFILLLNTFPSLAGMEAAERKLSEDKEYRKAVETWYAGGLPYVRFDSSLLIGFETTPTVEVPPLEGRKSNRIFELRIYESNTFFTLARKIKMFDDGEIAIFRRVGMLPVFFGETFVGQNMPNLTYMVAHDDLAAREKNWRAFGSDPEWQKLRAQPGLSDAEIVSNISNWILSPLPVSEIR